jgi:hypothetical protein
MPRLACNSHTSFEKSGAYPNLAIRVVPGARFAPFAPRRSAFPWRLDPRISDLSEALRGVPPVLGDRFLLLHPRS